MVIEKTERSIQSKMVIEETERSILNRIRSIKEFNHSMKDELVRLFYTPEPLAGQQRTTDYWLQLPMCWIRTVHTKRTNLVRPDDEPSPIESTNPSAFGTITPLLKCKDFLACTNPICK